MGATSATYGACACGSRGDTSRYNERGEELQYRSTEGYTYVDSLESASRHESHTWWCYTHGRSEGECLTTGRQSHGREDDDRCGYSEMLDRRQAAQKRRDDEQSRN
jgi:hypothetical protein